MTEMPPPLMILAAGLIAVQASAEDKIAMNCSGQETLWVGDQRPTTGTYVHYVSMDLTAGLVCYDKCTDLQTYRMADSHSDPIKIADLSSTNLSRHIVYDRRTALLTDQAETVLGVIRTKSAATAKCQPATFRQPPPIVLTK